MDFVVPSVIPSDDDSKLTEAYRKLRESEVTKDDKISEKDQVLIDKECEVIKNREIIAHDLIHEPVEIINKKGPLST